MSETPSSIPEGHIKITEEVAASSRITMNVGQEFITTTSDKLELCLIKYQKALQLQNEWIPPAGILLSVLPTLFGAQFNDFLGIKKSVWEALYLLIAIISGIWFLKALSVFQEQKDQTTVSKVIEDIRKGTDKSTTSSK